jgi:hypothetical protein
MRGYHILFVLSQDLSQLKINIAARKIPFPILFAVFGFIYASAGTASICG